MPTKNPKEPALDGLKKQNLSLPSKLVEQAKAKAELTHRGNLSRYIESLIERDLLGSGSGGPRVIEQLAEIWRSDIADSLKGKIPGDIDQQGLLGAFIAAVPRYVAAGRELSTNQRRSLGLGDPDNWRAPDICIIPTKIAAPICQLILLNARERAAAAKTGGERTAEQQHLVDAKGQVAYLESDMAELLVRNTLELFEGVKPLPEETAFQSAIKGIGIMLHPESGNDNA